MEDASLLDIVNSWSFWERPIPRGISRRVGLPDKLRDSLALAIQGVRRCGKSTLLRQLLERYGLDPRRCAFINFEDPRLANDLTFESLEQLVRVVGALHPASTPLSFFLDEVQLVDGWQRWLRTQLDQARGHQFVVTGSNSSLLSGELGSSLTGRHLTVELFPFDLTEFTAARPGATPLDFVREGGFPEPTLLDSAADADRLRRQYFEDIIERDIRERLGARSSRPIRQVAQMAYESAGSELSLRRVAGAVGIAIDTAGSYLAACESAYLLQSIPYFAFSERKRAARNRKYYPIDTGLRRVVVTPGGQDRGKSLECATFVALRRRYRDISYWRGDGEVDFVVRDGNRVVPIQVTWEAAEPRHEYALMSFYEAHPTAEEAVTITADTFARVDSI